MAELLVFRSRERLKQAGRDIEPRYARRLSDQLTTSFYEACRIGNLDAAWQLMQALEWEVSRAAVLFRTDWREDGDDAGAVRARYALEMRRSAEKTVTGTSR